METYRSTGTTPLSLLLSSTPYEITLDHSSQRKVTHSQDEKYNYPHGLDFAMKKAASSIRHDQGEDNGDFNVRVSKTRVVNVE